MHTTSLNIDLILKHTCGRLVSNIKCNTSKGIKKFSIDSRTFCENEAFIAIKGKNFDGHNFVAEIAKQHPSCIIISEEKEALFKNLEVPVISVKDTIKALKKMSQCALSILNCEIIEITGSIGKTTTRNMLFDVLSKIKNTSTQEKNFNNKIGLPLSVINFDKKTQYAILEIGMNNFGEIKELTHIPIHKNKVSIVTSIASNHIGNFKNKRDIAIAKSEIFSSMSSKDTAILFRDMPYFQLIKSIAKKNGIKKFITYGSHDSADIKIKKIETTSEKKIVFIKYQSKEISYSLPIVSKGIIMNSLAVFASLIALNIDAETTIQNLENFSVIEGRGNIEVFSTNRIINETYSSGPESLKNAIDYLIEISKKRKKVAIIGDILEVGTRSVEIHSSISNFFDNIDYLFTIGQESQNIKQKNNNKKHFYNVEDFLQSFKKIINNFENTDFLIKGSNLIGLSKITDFIKKYRASIEN